MAKSSFIGIDVKKGEAYRAARFAQVGLGAPSKLADPSEYFTRYGSPGEDVTRMPCALLNRNLTNLVKDAEAVKGKLKANKKFYSEASKLTYDALSGLPGDIITSRDFWRYLAVDVLFDVVYWKYPNDNGDRWGTNPSQFNRSMPLALFIRGQIASACTKEELSYLDAVNDIDVWTSHVVAVTYGSAPQAVVPYMEVLAGLQDPKTGGFTEKSRDVLRELARLVTATRSNYVFDITDKDTAREIVQSLLPEANRRGAIRTDARKRGSGAAD